MSFLPTIKKNGDFKKIFSRGKSVADRYLVLYFLKNNLEICRFGFVVSKKIGNAVIRNRIRRLFREACRLNLEKFPAGYDFLLVARHNTTQLKCLHLGQSAVRLLKKAGLNGG